MIIDPLPICHSDLQARSGAVEALLSAESVVHRECQMRLRELLKNLRDVDLARGLGRIQFFKVKQLTCHSYSCSRIV